MRFKINKTLSVILIIMILIFIYNEDAYAASGGESNSKATTTIERGNSTGNLNQYGSLGADDTYIYYCYGGQLVQTKCGMYPNYPTEEEAAKLRKAVNFDGTWYGYYWMVEPGIFAKRLDGSAPSKRITNELNDKIVVSGPSFMNVYDKKLYYLADKGKKDGSSYPVICKASVNGKSKSKVLYSCKKANTEITKMAVINDWIYFIETEGGVDDKLYRMQLDGTGKTFLIKTFSAYFDTDGTWIYYGTYTGINRINIIDSKKEQTVLTTWTIIDKFIVEEDKLYFDWYEDVCRVPLKTGQSTSNIKSMVKGSLLSVDKGWIYYESREKIHKIGTSGKNKKNLNLKVEQNIQIFNGSVYYPNEIGTKDES